MKKIFILLLFLAPMSVLYACDICGCSAGNYFIGPFPIFHRYFAGTRYSFRSFKTILKDDPGQYSKDFYQSFEIWGGYNIGKRWQLLFFMPYNVNRQHSDDGTLTLSGIGDLTLMANYELLGLKSGRRPGGLRRELRLGGGLKIPTGKYSLDPDELIPSANSQPGTGSLDFISSIQYNLFQKNWGLSNSLTYKMNQSASGFCFGNRFAASSFVFRNFITEKIQFRPNAGILYEQQAANRNAGMKVDFTGGHALLAAGGLELGMGKWQAGLNLQLPVSENYSGGQTRSRVRGMVHVSLLF